MEESNFCNGTYEMHYRFFTPRGDQGHWEVCKFPRCADAKRYPDVMSIVFDLAGDRWSEVYNIVTDPDFDFLRFKDWRVRNHMGELIFVYKKRTF